MATYREALALVEVLEHALLVGDLAALAACREAVDVFGADTVESYARVIRRGARHPLRSELVTRVGAALSEAEAPPRRVFAIAVDPASTPGAQGLRLAARGDDGPVRLRLDQAVAARLWGVWFTGEDPSLQATLDRALDDARIRQLSDHLRFLNQLLPHHDTTGLHFTSPGDVGARFEQLVLDVLNEERPIARRAPVQENLLEKTDLRVHVPGLKRPHGARVQVTTITDHARLRSKVGRIPRAREMVTVSPHTLATAAWGRSGTPAFPSAAAAEFFACMPPHARSVEALATALRSTLLGALGSPPAPLGPMASLPVPVRRLVRAFVDAEARATTAALRAREATTGARAFPCRIRTSGVPCAAAPARA